MTIFYFSERILTLNFIYEIVWYIFIFSAIWNIVEALLVCICILFFHILINFFKMVCTSCFLWAVLCQLIGFNNQVFKSMLYSLYCIYSVLIITCILHITIIILEDFSLHFREIQGGCMKVEGAVSEVSHMLAGYTRVRRGYDCGSEECTRVRGDVQEAWFGKNVWEICGEASRESWKCQSHDCCVLQTVISANWFPSIGISLISLIWNLFSSIIHFSEMCLRTNICSELSMFSVKSLHKLCLLSLTLFQSDFF